ncbi:uncharacterized protein LOC132612190 [Lycium barbarum]|uniref:uncharacterized protein LOC132612190 n=1 Tax=Lycium barbarum TaxID=112863 RepID=UPI00293E8886|nr:uncharacterized protein LOC132612190 [Lycium barbarum]
MAQEQQILLSSYDRPSLATIAKAIIKPEIKGNFELKERTVRQVQNTCQYMGKPYDDPHKHLMQFVNLSENFQYRDVPNDYVKLSLFPFSLIGEARDWLTNLPAGSITSWELLSNKFIDKFFSPKKTKELRGKSANFTQRDSESLPHAWEMYKGDLQNCPHDMEPKEIIGNYFVLGIRNESRALLNDSAQGQILNKTYEEMEALLELMFEGAYDYEETSRAEVPRKVARVFQQEACESYGEPPAYINCPQNPESGALPSDIEKNSRDFKAITLRNGRELEELPPKNNNKVDAELIPAQRTKAEKSPEKVMQQPDRVVTRPPIPFPQGFQKQKINAACKKFLDILKQVHINIPLVELFQEVLKYAKYVKDVVANKRRWTEFETVALTEECSSRVRSKIPPKLKDLGSFTISITISNIELADRSLAYPVGIIKDVLMKVGLFILPVDFIILDYEANKNVPLIMGRGFLVTVDAFIRVRDGKMCMAVDGQEATSDVFKATRLPSYYE